MKTPNSTASLPNLTGGCSAIQQFKILVTGSHSRVEPSLWRCSNSTLQLNQHCRRVLIECLGFYIHNSKCLYETLQADPSTFPRIQVRREAVSTSDQTRFIIASIHAGNDRLGRPSGAALSMSLAPTRSEAVMFGGVRKGYGRAEMFGRMYAPSSAVTSTASTGNKYQLTHPSHATSFISHNHESFSIASAR